MGEDGQMAADGQTGSHRKYQMTNEGRVYASFR